MKPILIFPLAGLGVRFLDQGYSTPKQLLKVDGNYSCLEKTILSIKNIHDFNVIAYVRDPIVSKHLNDILSKITNNFHIIDGKKTKSPIETLQRILKSNHQFIDPKSNVFVHTLDIDTPDNFNIDVNYPISTYTFKANSTNYSYVNVKNGYVSEIVDQRSISEFANAGIYGFGPVENLIKYCNKALELSNFVSGEMPLVDMYKILMADDHKIKAIPIYTIYIFGTPLEYEFCKKYIYANFNLKKAYLFSDHSGIATRKRLLKKLDSLKFETVDMGTFDLHNDIDYPDFAITAHENRSKEYGYIFGSCATGQGVNMALNKMSTTLSALIYNKFSFKMAIVALINSTKL